MAPSTHQQHCGQGLRNHGHLFKCACVQTVTRTRAPHLCTHEIALTMDTCLGPKYESTFFSIFCSEVRSVDGTEKNKIKIILTIYVLALLVFHFAG